MAETSTKRIVSIDVFRGLTMAVMIFVNDLASVNGLPWWTYHAHAKENLMTYVDMVFPFFLFIVGMSMPLAIVSRLKRNPSIGLLWRHILSRGAGLIVLGLILANAGKADATRIGFDKNAWALTGLMGGILFWLAPSQDPKRAALFKALRLVGLALLLATFATFRQKDGGWINGGYPEILGLIGYTYLASSLLYLLTRRWLWAPLGWTILLMTGCSLVTAYHFRIHLPLYVWPFESGAMASITMAGIVTATIFFGAHRWQSERGRMALAVAFSVVAAIAGWVLTPLGISKIRATPTWCLYSVAAATVVFTFLHWLCDVKKLRRWATFVKAAGENTLMTYLVPDLYYFAAALTGFRYIDTHFSSGPAGVIRALVFTSLVLGLASLLTRARVKLQL